MGVWKLFFGATRRFFTHPQVRPVPSLFLRSKKNSNTLIVFVPGFAASLNVYTPHLLLPLSQHYDVFSCELYRRGYTTKKKCIKSFLDIYNKFLSEKKYKKIIFIGHSMGNGVLVHLLHHKLIFGHAFYAITPSSHAIDTTHWGWAFKWFRFAPACLTFSEYILSLPIRVALACNDDVLDMDDARHKASYIASFRRNHVITIKEFDKRNHLFNYRRYDFIPFNKMDSNELLDDILTFIESVQKNKKV